MRHVLKRFNAHVAQQAKAVVDLPQVRALAFLVLEAHLDVVFVDAPEQEVQPQLCVVGGALDTAFQTRQFVADHVLQSVVQAILRAFVSLRVVVAVLMPRRYVARTVVDNGVACIWMKDVHDVSEKRLVVDERRGADRLRHRCVAL